MLFTCAEDFFNKVSKIKRLSRQEEKDLFVCMKAGDMTARGRIIENYLVIVAARIRRLPKDMQSLDLIYSCIQALERAVDQFNFLQESETFTHRLCSITQREFTRHIVKK